QLTVTVFLVKDRQLLVRKRQGALQVEAVGSGGEKLLADSYHSALFGNGVVPAREGYEHLGEAAVRCRQAAKGFFALVSGGGQVGDFKRVAIGCQRRFPVT